MKNEFINRNQLKLTTAIVGLMAMTSASAWGQTVSSFTNSAPTTVPDGNPVGVTEQFAVSGLSGSISDVQVQLDITGGFNGDLYAYLVSPTGQLSVLLNRVGLSAGNPVGYGDAGFNITLDGQAANNIHYYQGGSYAILDGQLTGPWAADGRNIDPQSSGTVFDGTSPTLGLDIYDGVDGAGVNGTWTLFVADLAAGGGTPVIDQTVLTVNTIPEPASLALGAAGAAALVLLRRKIRA
jgi:subtilisin-like proprotein convertase family protein